MNIDHFQLLFFFLEQNPTLLMIYLVTVKVLCVERYLDDFNVQ